MKNVLIPYSGGLDSTYLVWKNLNEGNNVTVVYYEIENNKDKVILEKIHRNKIINLLEEKFPNQLTNERYFDYKIYARGIVNNYSLIQVPIWMLGGFLSVNKKFDEIQMGYVMNDDALSYLEEIKVLYKAFQPFSNDVLPEITFPIIKKHKREMFEELPRDILTYVWSCENPKVSDNENEVVYETCGDCVVCQKYKEKISYKETNLFDNNIIRKFNKTTGELTFVFKSELNNILPYNVLLTANKPADTLCSKSNTIEIETDVLHRIINNNPIESDYKLINYYKETPQNPQPIQLNLFSNDEMENLVITNEELICYDVEE